MEKFQKWGNFKWKQWTTSETYE